MCEHKDELGHDLAKVVEALDKEIKEFEAQNIVIIPPTHDFEEPVEVKRVEFMIPRSEKISHVLQKHPDES